MHTTFSVCLLKWWPYPRGVECHNQGEMRPHSLHDLVETFLKFALQLSRPLSITPSKFFNQLLPHVILKIDIISDSSMFDVAYDVGPSPLQLLHHGVQVCRRQANEDTKVWFPKSKQKMDVIRVVKRVNAESRRWGRIAVQVPFGTHGQGRHNFTPALCILYQRTHVVHETLL